MWKLIIWECWKSNQNDKKKNSWKIKASWFWLVCEKKHFYAFHILYIILVTLEKKQQRFNSKMVTFDSFVIAVALHCAYVIKKVGCLMPIIIEIQFFIIWLRWLFIIIKMKLFENS